MITGQCPDTLLIRAVTPEEVEAAQAAGRTGNSLRRLFMARRAERMLASYQREGWLEDQPSRATGRMEIRPAAEMGPIIVCLDTSGSMAGKRETVAKVSLHGRAFHALYCSACLQPACSVCICAVARTLRQGSSSSTQIQT